MLVESLFSVYSHVETQGELGNERGLFALLSFNIRILLLR